MVRGRGGTQFVAVRLSGRRPAASGYVPFPGTPNVRLEEREFVESSRQFDVLDGIMIDGFHDGVRAYGWVKCFPGTVNGTIPCHLIRLERTHHEPSIVEIIARESIRDALVDFGDPITKIYQGHHDTACTMIGP